MRSQAQRQEQRAREGDESRSGYSGQAVVSPAEVQISGRRVITKAGDNDRREVGHFNECHKSTISP